MKIKNSVIVISLLLLAECHTYKKYDKKSFPNYVWNYDNGIIFKPTVEDISKNYQLSLGIRHLYGIQLDNLLVTVNTIAPSGKEEEKEYKIAMRIGQEYAGKCAGDMCDLETVVNENIKFDEVGQYTFFISHNFQDSQITGIMEVGLILDEK